MSACNFLAKYCDQGTRKLKKFTATQFAQVWSHFDTDGNGFIEEGELDVFLREFLSSAIDSGMGAQEEVLSDSALAAMKTDFMKTFDRNKDNRIEMTELAHILPTDENFLLLFRRENPLDSSIDFMHIWKQFDKDHSGFIESNELKDFLIHLLKEMKAEHAISEEKIDEYTETMLTLFDSNKDGKLQLSEMARLLPVKENYLTKPIFKNADKITSEDIDQLFNQYDRDHNGFIENEELLGFIKDLLDRATEDRVTYSEQDLESYRKVILDQWDVNHDGKINHDELKMILLQQSRLAKGERDKEA